MKGDNVNEIRSSIEALNQVWNEVSSRMYQQATAAGAGAQASGATSDAQTKDEKDVEEADFEVVDDDKK